MHSLDLCDEPKPDGTPVWHHFEFPSQWDEVDRGQLEAIARAQLANAEDAPTRFMLLKDLARLPTALCKRLPDADDFTEKVQVLDDSGPFRKPAKEFWQLLKQLDWTWKPPVYSISLMPTIEHDGLLWQGPDDRFDHLSFGQWMFSATLIRQLKSAPKEKQTAMFGQWLGATYQPMPSKGGPELNEFGAFHFDSMKIEQYGARLTSLPDYLKLAALYNFDAIHATLPITYRRVFDPQGAASLGPQGLRSMAWDVARSGVMGPMRDVEQNRLHELLGCMEDSLYKDEVAAQRAEEIKNRL